MGNAAWSRLSLMLSVCLLLCLLPAALSADVGDPPERVARLSYLDGSVSLQPAGEGDWTTASQNYTVTTGDRLYADENSRAELEIGPFTARLSQYTDLTVINLNDQLLQLGVTQGTVQVTVFNLPSGNTVEVDTPNGTLNLAREGSYRVDVYPDSGATWVAVTRGSLEGERRGRIADGPRRERRPTKRHRADPDRRDRHARPGRLRPLVRGARPALPILHLAALRESLHPGHRGLG